MAGQTRVLIIGTGGIGTITAVNLEASVRCHVTCVLRSNYDVVKERGFTIDSIDHGKLTGWRPSAILKNIPDLAADNIPPYDYILLTTKNTPDFPPAMPNLIAPAIHPSTTLILIQNGLTTISHPFQALYPSNTILSGISRMGANQTSPGVVLEDDPDRLFVGVFPDPDGTPPTEAAIESAKRFVDLYGAAGKAQVTYSDAVKFERWRKLLYNATWNPICALTSLDTGRMRLVSPDPAEPFSPINLLVQPAMREVCRVAEADGCPLTAGGAGSEEEEAMIRGMLEAEEVEVHCQPSMQQDAGRGAAWEVENLLGDVVRVGRGLGVKTPLLDSLYALARARMWGLREEWGMLDVKVEAQKRREFMQKSGD